MCIRDRNMGGTVEPPQNEGENAVLTGYAPVRTLRDYFAEDVYKRQV